MDSMINEYGYSSVIISLNLKSEFNYYLEDNTHDDDNTIEQNIL